MDIGRLSGLQSVVDLGALIARKRNGQAAEALRARFGGQGATAEMRFRYADLLIRADRGREAIPILLGLADEALVGGFVERAIGALRTVLGIDPHADVRARLRGLSRQMHAQPRHEGNPEQDEAAPLRARFGEGRWSLRMRLRLAGLVHGAGDQEAAAAVLMGLAEDLVEAGLFAHALAIMEGLERLRARELHAFRPREDAGSRCAEGPARTPADPFEHWLGALLREPWATDEPLCPAER